MGLCVFKYQLGPDRCRVELPIDANALSVGWQGNNLQLWALVDNDKDTVPRTFLTVGTGHRIDWPASKLRFVGTSHVNGLVFHTFEVL
jgi:hypothetical protein